MKYPSKLILTLAALYVPVASIPTQAEMSEAIQDIQRQWAVINYQTPETERAGAMHNLVDQCDAMSETNEGAEALIWCGIIRSTYAGMASPFSAMKYAKGARADFEKAIALDAAALSGSAYTSLGTLYAKVPGWPIGFGDKEKARKYLLQGLEINAAGIDANYFYGEFLLDQGEVDQARHYLLKAQQAPDRPDRPVADEGRRTEIEALLAKAQQ